MDAITKTAAARTAGMRRGTTKAREVPEVPFAVRNFSELPDDAGLTIPEAACILNIGVSTTWSWIASGKLKPPRRLGRTSRLTVGTIRELIAAGGQ